MDPATVVIVLAAHLICAGGLLFLIGRQMPSKCGTGPWSAGLALFGAAYIARLTLGLNQASPLALLIDAAMVSASMTFVLGLRQFIGRRDFNWRAAGLAMALFLACEGWAMQQHGPVGRHVALNTALGSAYLWLGWSAFVAYREAAAQLRRPLLFVTVLMSVLSVLTLMRGAHIGAQGLGVAYAGPFAQVFYGYSTLAAVLLAMGLLWMVFTRLNSQLAELATHDALTRVLNRTGLDEMLRRHLAGRNAAPLSVLAVDVDHFKHVNDSQGHAAGDEVLRGLAAQLLRHVRPDDVVARIGGEEFVVCCPGADREQALALAERLRQAVAQADLGAGQGRAAVRCTVSVGVAGPFHGLDGWPPAMAAADKALYAAKAGGRNCVVAA